MQALPLILAAALAIVIAPPALSVLAAGPLARQNYRGRTLACPLGVVVLAAAAVALGPLALVQQLGHTTVLRPELAWVAVYVLGVAALGLADDTFSGDARGWRGHAATVLRGGFSTGALKAVGAAGLALYVMVARPYMAHVLASFGVPTTPVVLLRPSTGHVLLGAAVLVLATNLFNLLDLRPGRAVKAFVLLGAALTLGAANLHPLWTLGVFAGPVLVVGLYDLRERGLLGDTGANLIGALAGAWLVLTLSTAGQIVALIVLVVITAYGEFRSISSLIESTPGLRRLDSIGRAHDARDA
jgi:UDP-N-acetylmuramyl pentapeptide phosphotransferase/UDP-N-acetylglucosamine-1-phosphate transferase